MQQASLIELNSQQIEYDQHSGGAGKTVVCFHPHPLYQGTMFNKVITTSTLAAKQLDYSYLRFNYPGVGQSSGHFGYGAYEAAQAIALIDALVGSDHLIFLGFSFGCSVIQQIFYTHYKPVPVIWIGASILDSLLTPLMLDSIQGIIHGEQDPLCNFKAMQSLARDASIPFAPVKDADHFFNGRQLELREQVKYFLQQC